jgi:hypothetical protein
VIDTLNTALGDDACSLRMLLREDSCPLRDKSDSLAVFAVLWQAYERAQAVDRVDIALIP